MLHPEQFRPPNPTPGGLTSEGKILGTSARYTWNHRRHIRPPIRAADADPTAISRAIAVGAERICDSLRQEEWRDTVTAPLLQTVSSTTARSCLLFGDLIDGNRSWPMDGTDLARFVSDGCGNQDGIHDLVARRALVATLRQLDIDVRAARDSGFPWPMELFCLFYTQFHIELMVEIVMHFVCETTLPLVSSVLLRTELGNWAVERVARLLPNPCEAAKTIPSTSPIRWGVEHAGHAVGDLIAGRPSEPDTSTGEVL